MRSTLSIVIALTLALAACGSDNGTAHEHDDRPRCRRDFRDLI